MLLLLLLLLLLLIFPTILFSRIILFLSQTFPVPVSFRRSFSISKNYYSILFYHSISNLILQLRVLERKSDLQRVRIIPTIVNLSSLHFEY